MHEFRSQILVSWLVALMRIPFLAVFLVGCATGELPPRTLSEPANPSAKEGVPVTFSVPAAHDAGSVDHHEHQSSSQGDTLYTCPMHPEVVQDHPGTCPKCGMTLKPKQ